MDGFDCCPERLVERHWWFFGWLSWPELFRLGLECGFSAGQWCGRAVVALVVAQAVVVLADQKWWSLGGVGAC